MSKIMDGYYRGTVDELKKDYPGIQYADESKCDIMATCGTCMYVLTAAYTDGIERCTFCQRLPRNKAERED